MYRFLLGGLPFFLSIVILSPSVPADADRAQGAASPSLRDLWLAIEPTLTPLDLTITRDEIVPSLTDPGQKVRRVQLKFYSQEIDGRRWGHPSVIFMPADQTRLAAPDRRGKVVIVGQRSLDSLITGSWRESFLGNYGDPIAVRTGYPTMILPVPGEDDATPGREIPVGPVDARAAKTKNPADHAYVRLAIPYLRALDVFATILHERTISAVIGGHSKRATSALTAAAMDPARVAGVVFAGNETTFGSFDEGPFRILSPFDRDLPADVLYIGATNEDGYRMFNVNRVQARLQQPWTIEYIPNYRHADQSEQHFLDWQMWVSHVFDRRPLTRISDLRYEDTDEGTLLRARIESANALLMVQAWTVFCDDVPYWRDLMWYPEFMTSKGGGVYEAYVPGKLPDAWLVEVKDTSHGIAGYVSSLPQDITHKETRTRESRGSRSRNWEPRQRPTTRWQ